VSEEAQRVPDTVARDAIFFSANKMRHKFNRSTEDLDLPWKGRIVSRDMDF
jgi:hypothetical protein